MSPSHSLLLEKEDGIVVVSFSPAPVSITEEELPGMSERILNAAAQADSRIVFDLANVEFFGSSFIETLFRVWNRVRTKPNGGFALCCLRPHCQEVLEITNLTSMWKIYPSRPDAIAALKSGAAR